MEKKSSERTLPAALASLGVHGLVFLAVATGARVLPEKTELSPLRFSGQTFEVDALGAAEEENATASAPSSPATQAAAEPETAGSDEAPAAEAQEVETRPDETPEEAPVPTSKKPSPEPESQEPDETRAKGAEVSQEREAAPKPASLEDAPPKKPIDPFDLAQLPGEATNDQAASEASTTGSYGAEGPEAGTIDVFAAFLRKLPEAAKNDRVWESLKDGPAGSIEFTLTLSDRSDVLLIDIEERPESPPPDHLVRSVLLTRKFLRYSRLAWAEGQTTGSQKLRLTARVEKRPANKETPYAHGIQAFGIHGEHHPSGAFFTYFSGQHIEVSLTRVQ